MHSNLKNKPTVAKELNILSNPSFGIANRIKIFATIHQKGVPVITSQTFVVKVQFSEIKSTTNLFVFYCAAGTIFMIIRM